MTLFQVAAVSVVVAVMCAALKEGNGKLIPFVLVLGGVFLTGWGVVRLTETVETLEALGGTPVSPYLSLILKALGIGYITKIGGDVCRDLGHESVAQKLELCGKGELLCISLPYLGELVARAVELVGGGL